jgi:hypothetical protein
LNSDKSDLSSESSPILENKDLDYDDRHKSPMKAKMSVEKEKIYSQSIKKTSLSFDNSS